MNPTSPTARRILRLGAATLAVAFLVTSLGLFAAPPMPVAAAPGAGSGEDAVLAQLQEAAAGAIDVPLRNRILFVADLLEQARSARKEGLGPEAGADDRQARDTLDSLVSGLNQELQGVAPDDMLASRQATLKTLASALTGLEAIVGVGPTGSGGADGTQAGDWHDAVSKVRDHLAGSGTRDEADRAIRRYRDRLRAEAGRGSGAPAIQIQMARPLGRTYSLRFANANGPSKQPVTIRNTSTAPLVIHEIALAVGEAFSLATNRDRSPRARLAGPITIQPGGLTVVIVKHDPRGNPTLYTDMITIASNALDDPVAAISLVASPWLPVLQSTSVDFETVDGGAVATRSVTIGYVAPSTVGLPDLDVEMRLEAGHVFFIKRDGQEHSRLPLALRPRETRTIELIYHPQRQGQDEDVAVIWLAPKGRPHTLAAPLASVSLRGKARLLDSRITAQIERTTIGGQSFGQLKVSLDPPIPTELNVHQTGSPGPGGYQQETTDFTITTGDDGTYRRILGGYRDGTSVTQAGQQYPANADTWTLKVTWAGNERYKESATEFTYREVPNSWQGNPMAFAQEAYPFQEVNLPVALQRWFPKAEYGTKDKGNRDMSALLAVPISLDFPVPLSRPVTVTKVTVYFEAGGMPQAQSEQYGHISPLPGEFPATAAGWLRYRDFRADRPCLKGESMPCRVWFSGDPVATHLAGSSVDKTLTAITWEGSVVPKVVAGDAGPQRVYPSGVVYLEADLGPKSPLWSDLEAGRLTLDTYDPKTGATSTLGRAPVTPAGIQVRFEVVGRIGSDPFLLMGGGLHKVVLQYGFPILTVEPNTVLSSGVNAGSALVGQEHESAQTVRLRNAGTEALQVAAVAVTPPNDGLTVQRTRVDDAFGHSQGLPITIEPGKHKDLVLELRFKPTQARPYSGSLVFGDLSKPWSSVALPWSGIAIEPLTLTLAHPSEVTGDVLKIRPEAGWNNYLANLPGPLVGLLEVDVDVHGLNLPIDEPGYLLHSFETNIKSSYGPSARLSYNSGNRLLKFTAQVKVRPGLNRYSELYVPVPELGGTAELSGSITGSLRLMEQVIGLTVKPAEAPKTDYTILSRKFCPQGSWKVTGEVTQKAIGIRLVQVTQSTWDLDFHCIGGENVHTGQTYIAFGGSIGAGLWDDFDVIAARATNAYLTDDFESWFGGAIGRLSLDAGPVVPVASASGGLFFLQFWGGARVKGVVGKVTPPESLKKHLRTVFPPKKGENYVKDISQDAIKEGVGEWWKERSKALTEMTRELEVEFEFPEKSKHFKVTPSAEELKVELEFPRSKLFKVAANAEFGIFFGQPVG